MTTDPRSEPGAACSRILTRSAQDLSLLGATLCRFDPESDPNALCLRWSGTVDAVHNICRCLLHVGRHVRIDA